MPKKPSRIRPYEIRPLLEFYPLLPEKRRVKWQILKRSKRSQLIQNELRAARGLYIFYNSQCRAIYLGKADRKSLWGELNSAFNRKRESQSVFKVKHPQIGSSFLPYYRKKRKIKRRNVYLRDIATFISAYEVGEKLIGNLEALLMRAFPNELTNARMETIRFTTKK